jgi:hypothetical protein
MALVFVGSIVAWKHYLWTSETAPVTSEFPEVNDTYVVVTGDFPN